MVFHCLKHTFFPSPPNYDGGVITKLSGGQTILPGDMKFYMRKCKTKCFQTQVSDFDYLNYFLNNAVEV